MAARMVPRRPTVVEASTEAWPSVPGRIPQQLVRLLVDRMPRLQTSRCRDSTAASILVRSLPPRAASDSATPRAETPQPETLSTRQVPACIGTARAIPTARMGRHRASALPPKRRLPAGVHGSTQNPLDLGTHRLFAGHLRPPTACRLLQRDVTRARLRSVRPRPLRSKLQAHRMAPP